YREIRSRYRMLDLCRDPEAVTEVTLLPIQQFTPDAAILFSDITIPFLGMEVPFDIVGDVGPVIERPIRVRGDVQQLPSFEAASAFPFIHEAIVMLKRELSV